MLILEINMRLRKYTTDDCSNLAELFYNTVHAINAKDYTKPQLDVWATGTIDLSAWGKSFSEHNTIIAKVGDIIVGFGDMDECGYIDRLYVHKDYQNKGVASAILAELERQAVIKNIVNFNTHASITAKPFFEKRGYNVLRENTVVRGDIELANFIMEKNCTIE